MRTGLARVFWGLGVVYAALVVWAALVLPERVPAHWGSAAPPDRWAGRTETIVMFALLGIVMVGIFAVLLVLVSRISSLTWMNLPNKQFWQRPENLGYSIWMSTVRWRVPPAGSRA